MSAAAPNVDVPTPDPLHETPPHDRFCDLILNGGVASGVVYPWAMVELARHYRFRNIGGNSVGAMAAALAAAAEYGRCQGHPHAFEVLRQAPAQLAAEQGGRTKMLRLFQPEPALRRLFDVLLSAVSHANRERSLRASLWAALGAYGLRHWLLLSLAALLAGWAFNTRDSPYQLSMGLAAGWVLVVFGSLCWRHLRTHLRTPVAQDAVLQREHRRWAVLSLLALAAPVAAFALWGWRGPDDGRALGVLAWVLGALPLALGVPVCLLVVAGMGWRRGLNDLRALARNDYGLCTGRAPEPATEEALIEWLHKAIQLSAGRGRDDPPLTFADLWHAPRVGQPPVGPGSPPADPSIRLHMFSTNVTLGRPVRWPLLDPGVRLFFHPAEWQRLFPPTLLAAVVKVARPYAPDSLSDPVPDQPDEPGQTALKRALLEIPAGALPIAVAARMSLCFPVLFSCVPVYAIDYEPPPGQRRLRRCLMTDGGICTNFPVHLFDAAHPRWPTFGLMLSRRLAPFQDQSVWLPEGHLAGRADNWQRGVPGAELGDPPGPPEGLLGLLAGVVATALDWSDNLTSRMPHVRNRVLRMALRLGEGQLNLAMPGKTIMRMAHEYGTLGGRQLVERFCSPTGGPTEAWQEHLYVRAVTQLRTLRQHLAGYRRGVQTGGHSQPLDDLLARATRERPLKVSTEREHEDLAGAQLSAAEAAALQSAVDAVVALELALDEVDAATGPYQPVPSPELRLRSSI